MPYPILKHLRICTAVLTSCIFAPLAGCNGSGSADTGANTPLSQTTAASELLRTDAVLHQRLQAVHDADAAYNDLLESGATTATLDDRNGQVIQAEIALQQTIDSLEQQHKQAGTQLLQWTGYFKNALQSRRALSDLRMVLSADSDDSTTTQQTLRRLQAELQDKNKRIAALEQANRNAVARQSQEAGNSLQPGNPAAYTPAKGETPADLRQRNKNLSLALNNMQVKYFVLGRDYLVLKKQHERTLAELAALRKSGN
jgi:hypothetical protein